MECFKFFAESVQIKLVRSNWSIKNDGFVTRTEARAHMVLAFNFSQWIWAQRGVAAA
jgi:hypothetical protein